MLDVAEFLDLLENPLEINCVGTAACCVSETSSSSEYLQDSGKSLPFHLQLFCEYSLAVSIAMQLW